jgi:hypothetical protein
MDGKIEEFSVQLQSFPLSKILVRLGSNMSRLRYLLHCGFLPL